MNDEPGDWLGRLLPKPPPHTERPPDIISQYTWSLAADGTVTETHFTLTRTPPKKPLRPRHG